MPSTLIDTRASVAQKHPRPQSRGATALSALFVALAIGLLVAVAGSPPAAGQAPGQPNIVVVMTDDQTVNQTRVMGTTQRLLRDRGVSFTRAFASYPLCCPSRATFLTGQHSHNHGVLGNGTPIGGFDALDRNDTLGVWLQDAGYRTIQVGKFLNGYGVRNPTFVPPGWDEWIAAPDSTTNRYFNYDLNENGSPGHLRRLPRRLQDRCLYRARRSSNCATRASPDRLRNRSSCTSATRRPTCRPTRLPVTKAAFSGKALPRPSSFNERNVADKPRFIRRLNRLNGSRVRRVTRNHRSQLRSLLSVDEGIGRIVDELAAQGLLGDTYVIFTSDNGFFSGEHRVAKGKYLPYEPSIRVPLIIRGPGLGAGARSDELVSNVDLAPTILQLAGAGATVTVDGRSLLPFARNTTLRSGRPIFLEANSVDDPSTGIPYSGLRTRRFKYIRYRSGEEELYDLARDPNELASRHRARSYRRTRAALRARLGRYRDCAGAGCRAGVGSIPGPR